MATTYSIPSDFVLKGFILKSVSQGISDKLDGILKGVIAEVVEHEDETHSANIFLLDRSTDEVMATPYVKWTEEGVTEMEGEPFCVRYEVPPNRSRGLFVSEDNRVFSPLVA